jgi:hypothetical protein
MRRLWVLLALVVGSFVLALPAGAGTTTVAVSATFIETFNPSHADCPDIALEFNCGLGVVVPFGAATEEVAINVCGDGCNVRYITLSGRTLTLLETASDFTCTGGCPTVGEGQPFSVTFSESVIDGTGTFAGATGSLAGTLSGTFHHSLVQLSGTITLDT